MTYQLGHMIVITEFPRAVCHTPVEGHIALDMPTDVNRASKVAVVIFVSPILLVKTLHQRFIQEIGKQMQQEIKHLLVCSRMLQIEQIDG